MGLLIGYTYIVAQYNGLRSHQESTNIIDTSYRRLYKFMAREEGMWWVEEGLQEVHFVGWLNSCKILSLYVHKIMYYTYTVLPPFSLLPPSSHFTAHIFPTVTLLFLHHFCVTPFRSLPTLQNNSTADSPTTASNKTTTTYIFYIVHFLLLRLLLRLLFVVVLFFNVS